MYAFRPRSTLFALIAAIGFAPSTYAQPAGSRGITLEFKSANFIDEDDPLSHDEPYLIVTKFRFKTEIAGSGVRIVPGTLKVENVMQGHGSMGNKKDSFTREGRRWTIPTNVSRAATEVVPPNEPGWVVGAAVTYMEKDGFSKANSLFFSKKVQEQVQRSITTMSFSEKDIKRLTDSIIRKVSADLSKSVKNLDLGGTIRGVASGVDPDDYGGTALLVAVTGASGKVYFYSGMPTADLGAALADVKELSREKTTFGLRFPMGDLSKVPSNARFMGRASVFGEVRIWTLKAPD